MTYTTTGLEGLVYLDTFGDKFGEDWETNPSPELKTALLTQTKQFIQENLSESYDTLTAHFTQEEKGVCVTLDCYQDGEEDPSEEVEFFI